MVLEKRFEDFDEENIEVVRRDGDIVHVLMKDCDKHYRFTHNYETGELLSESVCEAQMDLKLRCQLSVVVIGLPALLSYALMPSIREDAKKFAHHQKMVRAYQVMKLKR